MDTVSNWDYKAANRVLKKGLERRKQTNRLFKILQKIHTFLSSWDHKGCIREKEKAKELIMQLPRHVLLAACFDQACKMLVPGILSSLEKLLLILSTASLQPRPAVPKKRYFFIYKFKTLLIYGRKINFLIFLLKWKIKILSFFSCI
ncbi:hypothetical protein LguiA_029932 [Lonicera macranthoides]